MAVQIEAVVRRIKGILAADPTARILAFSTWADLLGLVSHALHANRVPHVYPRTRQSFETATRSFRMPGPGPSPPRAQGDPRGAPAPANQAADDAMPSENGAPERGSAGGDTSGGAQRGVRRRPVRSAECGSDVRVLLLLTKQGANGLNLTGAGHGCPVTGPPPLPLRALCHVTSPRCLCLVPGDVPSLPPLLVLCFVPSPQCPCIVPGDVTSLLAWRAGQPRSVSWELSWRLRSPCCS